MAWNFRKRIKIAPGIHLNLSKGGISASVGPKGAKITVGKRGTYLNTSILGLGIYQRHKITSNNSTEYNHLNNNLQTNTTMNNFGCLAKGWGYFCLLGLICSIIMFFQGEKNVLLGNIVYIPSIIIIFKKQIIGIINNITGRDDALEDEFFNELMAENPVEEQSRYDFFLEKYNDA